MNSFRHFLSVILITTCLGAEQSNLANLIQCNKQKIDPIFQSFRYQLDEIIIENELNKKAKKEGVNYFSASIRPAYNRVLIERFINEVSLIDGKLDKKTKLKNLTENEEFIEYFDNYINPTINNFMFKNQEEHIHKLKGFPICAFLSKIDLKMPTRKPEVTTLNRRIKYPRDMGVKFGMSYNNRPGPDLVKLMFVLSELGKATNFRVISDTNELLNDAAIKGVSSWNFVPAIKEGRIVKTRMRLDVRFGPPL